MSCWPSWDLVRLVSAGQLVCNPTPVLAFGASEHISALLLSILSERLLQVVNRQCCCIGDNVFTSVMIHRLTGC